jgi:hypothetical protein
MGISETEKAAIAGVRQQSVQVFDQYYVVQNLQQQACLAQTTIKRLKTARLEAASAVRNPLKEQPTAVPITSISELPLATSLPVRAAVPRDMSHLSERIARAARESGLSEADKGTWPQMKAALKKDPSVSERQYRNWRRWVDN